MELRKSNVVFEETTHRYLLGDKVLKGITATLIPAIFGDYTKDIPEPILRKAAERGTMIHSQIECIDEWDMEPTNYESAQYIRLRNEMSLKPVASEYIVTDGQDFASPIDKVYEGDIIADIKTTSELHYAEVTFQLSWYAAYYEELNDRKAQKALVVWLPKEKYGNCAIIEVPIISEDIIRQIVADYLEGNDVTSYAELFTPKLPQKVQDAVGMLVEREHQIKDMELALKNIKAERDKMHKVLIEYFVKTSTKSLELGDVKFSYIAPTTRISIDAKGLKEKYPNVYQEFMRESAVRESIRTTITNN